MMDLNQACTEEAVEEEEDEAAAGAELEEALEGDEEREETGLDIFKREREERIAAMKRKRREEAAYLPKSQKQQRAGSQSASQLPTLPPPPSNTHSSFGPLPEGWLDCPGTGEPVGWLIPSKAPLGEGFKEAVDPGHRYSPQQLLRQQRQKGREIKMVVDLTNTSRYYKEQEWRKNNVKYLKLPCRGRDEVPDEETVNTFVFEVMRFLAQNARERKYVVVHCTHGHNRTGFMIVHFLMRTQGGSVADKLEEFAKARPPGIYKKDYIESLFTFYHQVRPREVECPPTPEWKRPLDLNEAARAEEEDDDDDGGTDSILDEVNRAMQSTEEAGMSIDDVLGAAIPEDQQMDLQRSVCIGLGLSPGRYFPGSQPVSLDRTNLQLLRQRIYYVTWKADGTRYMVLICSDGVFLIDRNFRFRRIQMRFPLRGSSQKGQTQHLTLLDGEMVVDTDPKSGKKERRYLIYDLMMLHGTTLAKLPFSERWAKIESEIVMPRKMDAAQNSSYLYSSELFRIRRKDFWLLSTVDKLLHGFIPQLSHESDGLIFQGWHDKYVARTHEGLLKWKYAHMNSVDFLLQKTVTGKWVLLLMESKKLKQLEGAKVVFPGMEEEVVGEMEGKVIECCWKKDKEEWEYMRLRPDKEHPNAWHTYIKVMASIDDNITEKVLLEEVDALRSLPMYQEEEKRQAAKQKQHHHHHHPQKPQQGPRSKHPT